MDKIIRDIVILWFLLAVIGCGKNEKFNEQLLAVDKIIDEYPDSSWNVLNNIDVGKFDKLNEAYYNLLYVESGYKSYRRIIGDSSITVAEDFFASHKNEYPTLHARSVLVKGYVKEELKDLLGAMSLYAKAKYLSINIAEAVYGYSLFRAASLYQDQYLMADTAIAYYKLALQSFRKSGNRRMQRASMGEIGRLYRSINKDSAYFYLTGAIELADALKDEYRVASYNTILAGFYYHCLKNYKKTKEVAMQNIKERGEYLDIPACYCYAALAYMELNDVDSAKIILDKIPPVSGIADSVLIYMAESKFYKLTNQPDKFYQAYQRCSSINDSILTHSLRSELMEMARKVEKEDLMAENRDTYNKYYTVCVIMSLCIIMLLISIIVAQRLKSRYNLALQEMDSVKNNLTDTVAKISSVEQELLATKKSDMELASVLNCQISAIKELIELSNEFENRPEIFMKRFRQTMNISDNNAYWADLFVYINYKYNNILDIIKLRHPNLTQLEMNFISLMCCGLSNTVVMVSMGYKSIKSVYNKKILIAKKCNVSDLENYINELKESL